jgi:hypothetical protein
MGVEGVAAGADLDHDVVPARVGGKRGGEPAEVDVTVGEVVDHADHPARRP